MKLFVRPAEILNNSFPKYVGLVWNSNKDTKMVTTIDSSQPKVKIFYENSGTTQWNSGAGATQPRVNSPSMIMKVKQYNQMKPGRWD